MKKIILSSLCLMVAFISCTEKPSFTHWSSKNTYLGHLITKKHKEGVFDKTITSYGLAQKDSSIIIPAQYGKLEWNDNLGLFIASQNRNKKNDNSLELFELWGKNLTPTDIKVDSVLCKWGYYMHIKGENRFRIYCTSAKAPKLIYDAQYEDDIDKSIEGLGDYIFIKENGKYSVYNHEGLLEHITPISEFQKTSLGDLTFFSNHYFVYYRDVSGKKKAFAFDWRYNKEKEIKLKDIDTKWYTISNL